MDVFSVRHRQRERGCVDQVLVMNRIQVDKKRLECIDYDSGRCRAGRSSAPSAAY